MCADCDKRERERASKVLKLNGGPSDYDYSGKLQAASSSKPTIRIKRLSFSGHQPNSIKLKGASSNQIEREKAEKALRLNGC